MTAPLAPISDTGIALTGTPAAGPPSGSRTSPVTTPPPSCCLVGAWVKNREISKSHVIVFMLTLQFLNRGVLTVEHTLSDIEVRVLGALIEKEITTPDYYPLSLNALVAACNQSSNRHPVVHYDESTVTLATGTRRARQ